MTIYMDSKTLLEKAIQAGFDFERSGRIDGHSIIVPRDITSLTVLENEVPTLTGKDYDFHNWELKAPTGQIVSAPVAFQGINWRVWPDAPEGIEYEILDKKLPQNWQYTVGPDVKVVRWDSEIWEPWSKWETIEDC